MATSQLRGVIQTLRSATQQHDEAGLTDGQLLESYVQSREESAFAALVHRHGPMVWGVCRRALPSHQDAEDAFQATFLVLVRKAASVMPRDLVANWLYGVAHQTALKARAMAARRHGREKQVTAMPEPIAPQHDLPDLQALDHELNHLPDKYRAVIVLCDLQGKTRKEAARHFHLPEGTVASRLATARGMLARRLAQPGRALSGAALAALLAQTAAPASVPLSVTASTIEAASLFAAGQATAAGISVNAVALAEGALKTMLLTKLKMATALLVAAAVLGASVTALARHGQAGKPGDPPAQEKKEPARQPVARSAETVKQPAKEKAEPVGKKEGEARFKVVAGVVKAVDAKKRSLTIAHQEGETSSIVPENAHISIDDKPGNLAGLPVGASVCATLQADEKTVHSIQAGGASVFATVKAVDADKSTITVTGQPESRTYSVTASTVIRIDGKPGKLAAIPAGASLHALNLCVDQKTARSINVEGPSVCQATVKAVDAEKRTITVADKAAGEAGKAYTVADDAEVILDSSKGKLAEVPAGSFVNLLLSVDRATVRRVHAQGPTVGGCGGCMVKAVDADKGTITFDDRGPADVAGKTFTLAPDANIAIDGRRGKLADLPAGAFVNLTLSVKRSTARELHAGGPRIGGVVKAVDARKSTITVADRTFSVAKDVIVGLDDKRCNLAGLPSGVSVTLTLRVDQKTVALIQARAP